MSMAIISPKLPALSSPIRTNHLSHGGAKTHFGYTCTPFSLKRFQFQLSASADNGSSFVAATVAEEESVAAGSNGSPPPPPKEEEPLVLAKEKVVEGVVSSFQDARWVGGTWDLKQFVKNGNTDWDAVIDAEVRRRKLMEENPQSSSNEEPIFFDTSIIPWWAWMKRFHLPEAELLNGRAAMIGFFMAYFVDSLTGVGLVDQMGNFFCKTLLFVAVAGVLLVRKNEDLDNLKKLFEETTFYDKQWQATWQDDEAKKNV